MSLLVGKKVRVKKLYEKPCIIKKGKIPIVYRLLNMRGVMWYINYIAPFKAYDDYWKEVAPHSIFKEIVMGFECDHAKEEECPHYDASIGLHLKLEKLKEAKCERCEEAHDLLTKYEIEKIGHIWSVGSGVWSVKARIEKLIEKLKTKAVGRVESVFKEIER